MELNVADLRALADFIEKAEYDFDMSDPHASPKCGSAGCIAGHAAVLWPSVRSGWPDAPPTYFSFKLSKLNSKLGLTKEQCEALFYEAPDEEGHAMPLECVTRSMAVAAVRRLADTGKVEFRRDDATEYHR